MYFAIMKIFTWWDFLVGWLSFHFCEDKKKKRKDLIFLICHFLQNVHFFPYNLHSNLLVQICAKVNLTASLQTIGSELGSYNVAKCWTSQSSVNLISHYTSTYLLSLDIGCSNKNNTVLLFLRQLHSMPIWSVRQTADVWYYLDIVFSFLNKNWTLKKEY